MFRGNALPLIILAGVWFLASTIGRTFQGTLIVITALCVIASAVMIFYMVFVQGRRFSYSVPWKKDEIEEVEDLEMEDGAGENAPGTPANDAVSA